MLMEAVVLDRLGLDKAEERLIFFVMSRYYNKL